LRSSIFALLWLLLTGAVYTVNAAFTIEPAIVVFFADRGEKTAYVEVVHTGGGPAAVQFSVIDRVLDLDGVLANENPTKNSTFLVHPAQVILYPKERATVQIQYIGKGKVTKDIAYVLHSQEVPIDVAKEEDGGVNVSVNMVMNYFTVISLETGKPGKLVFVSSKAIGNGKIEVIAENKGDGRVKMERINLMVNNTWIKNLTGKGNSIMPGTKRRFTFEWPNPVTAKEVTFAY
jgi:P pilus assembly chaperone PapD